MNELPRTPDKTVAFFRRVCSVEFHNKFTGKRQDRILLARIPREEYEGLAAKCVEVLCDTKERGFAFTNKTEASEMERRYEKLTNPLKTFLNKVCQKDFGSQIPTE